MEYMKVILLLSISISCSLSQHLPHKNQVGQNELKECVCFPKQKQRQPVIAYLKPFGGEIKRTVIYVYTDSNNQSSVYIPNVEKQLLFPDLTFDDGDHVRSVAVELVDSLYSYQRELTNYNVQSPSNHIQFDYSQNNPANNKNTNQVIITHKQVMQNNNLDLQANKKRNEEALKNIVHANNNDHGGFVNNIVQVQQQKINKVDHSKPIHADLKLPQDPASQIHSNHRGCGGCSCGGKVCSKDYVSEYTAANPESNKQQLDVVLNNIVKNNNSPKKIELEEVSENILGNVYSIDKQRSEQELIDWYIKQNILKEQVTGDNTHSQNYHDIIQKVYVPYQPHSVSTGQSEPVKVIRVHHDRPSRYLVVPQQIKNVKGNQPKTNIIGSFVSEVEENIPFLPFVSNTVNNLLDIPNKLRINGGISTSSKDGMKVGAGLNVEETSRDEDGVKIKIIGGHPATSSGTPLQVKA